MRHGMKGRKLGRVASHRRAMYRNQLASLFVHERICTTISKAKSLRPLAEKMVTLARREGTPEQKLHVRRLVMSRLGDSTAAKRLIEEIAPRFKERPGGYTRILKLGRMRRGDNAELAIIEFVDFEFVPRDQRGEAAAPSRKGKKAKAGADEKPAAVESDDDEKPKKASKKPKAQDTDAD